MKIAYLTPLYFHEGSTLGGGERYVVNLARSVAMARPDWTIEILSYGSAGQVRQLDARVVLHVMAAANAPANTLDTLSWDLPSAIRDADLVHVHQAFTRSAEVGILAAKLYRKPICITDHGGTTTRLGLALGSLELADRIVCQSEFAASLMRTTTKVELVKGGVDDALFTPPAERRTRDRFVYVGRLLPHKGIDRLLAALPADLPLSICGRPYRADYFEVLRKLARGKSVEFVLDADDGDLRELYHRAWSVVLPSVYRDWYGTSHVAPELMGLTLLEAMACGTPAVCSRVGGMPEFVRHGETGYVFDSLAELRQRLRRLAADPELVDQLGAEARRAVEQEYGLTPVGREMAATYEGVVVS